MTHDDLVLWCDKNAQHIVDEVLGIGWNVTAKTWEFPVMFEGRSCYVDLRIECRGPDHDNPGCEQTRYVAVEAKVKIDFLGELIRQLRRYARAGARVVVTLDDRHQKIIKEQGFGFVLADGSQKSFDL